MATRRSRAGGNPRRQSASRAKGANAPSAASAASAAVDAATSLTGSIRSIAGQVMDLAGAAVDASLGVSGLLARDPKRRRDLAKAGNFLRGFREQAGMTVADVGQALDLKDAELLALAENGKIALPFEMILRLASVLARNDPIPFVMSLTNTYSPSIGRMLQALGIGRLVEHARREHDFVNIYRSRDAARKLSDEQFARVLAFLEAAFDLALDFASKEPKRHKAAHAPEDPAG
jgi:transcriptional regulator with XRE-family HTH domain